MNLQIREAIKADLETIRGIYNQGIEERNATLEVEEKSYPEMEAWFAQRQGRYTVLVAEVEGQICGWASLSPYSNRSAHDGIAMISIYIDRDWRGKKLGEPLLEQLEHTAKKNQFHKLVLFALPFNYRGQRLYLKRGFQTVGTFQNHGRINGEFVDVLAMEKVFDR